MKPSLFFLFLALPYEIQEQKQVAGKRQNNRRLMFKVLKWKRRPWRETSPEPSFALRFINRDAPGLVKHPLKFLPVIICDEVETPGTGS